MTVFAKRGRTAVIGLLLAAGLLCLGAVAAQAQCSNSAPAGPGLWIPAQAGTPGSTASISVKLAAGGAQVAGTQSDITFPANAPVAAKANGKPDCAVNAAIDKSATSFAFRPSGCSGAACTAVRALVLSTDNTDAIPDGSVLFTCNVAIAAGASGNLAYTFSGVILSDPSGTKVTDTGNVHGEICMGGEAATPTPRGGGSCLTPLPAPAGPALWIPDQSADHDATTATIAVKLASGSAQVAGTQSDITFPTNAPIAAKANGKPDCAANPDINKGATSFAFRPSGCSGAACTAVRALVLSTDNTAPIPNGSVLFTCNVAIASGASGNLDYTVSGVILSDPSGTKVTDAGDQRGQICTGVAPPSPSPGGQCPTPLPAPSGPALWIPDQSVTAGTTAATITVKLASGGAQIAGTQSDITFPANAPIAAKANGKPDCAVNPDIDKGATSFAFRPSGCSGAACTAVRALVLSTDNTDPMPNGSVLFTCNVAITSGGNLDYTFSGVALSDPSGTKVRDTGDGNGRLCTLGGGASLWIPDGAVASGTGSTTISVKLMTRGAQVAGVQSDISFPANAPITARANGTPDCAVNADIDKGATSFAFRPNGCSGTACTAVRALVLSTSNIDPIPDGSVLFTCTIAIAPGVSGCLAYTFGTVILSDPSGARLNDTGSQNGQVCIAGFASPTPTPAPPTPLATATATPTLAPNTAVLRAGDGVLFHGAEGQIPIFLTNDVAVSALSFYLTDTPDESAVDSSRQQPCTVDSQRAAGFGCTVNEVGGTIRGVLSKAPGENDIVRGFDAQVATVFITDQTPECTIGTTSTLQLSNTDVVGENSTPVAHTSVSGLLHCLCRGDSNGDGNTDATDVARCLDFSVLRRAPAFWESVATHVTCGDRPLSVVDCQTIVDVFVGGVASCPRQCISVNSTGGPAIVTFATAQARPGAAVTVTVGLENESDEVRALQFGFPAGGTLKVQMARAIERAAGLQATAGQDADGTINVGLMSLSGAAIAPGTGPVLALDLVVDRAVTGDITLHADNKDVRVGGEPRVELAGMAQDGLIQVVGITPQPRATPTPVAVPSAASGGGGGGGGGGCAVAPSSEAPGAWVLAVALLLPLTRRRRVRPGR